MRLLKAAKIMIATTAALTLALATAPVMTAYAATGWVSENGGWVYYDSNASRHKGWIQTKDGYYYMDLSAGTMTKGFKKIDSNWYYFGTNGLMETGWKQVGGSWYYLLEDGKMAHDTWIDRTYYVGTDGRMLTNTTTPDGYRVGADGRWVRNSQKKLSREQVETVFQRYWEDAGLSSPYGVSYWGIERMTDRYVYIHERWYTGSHGEATVDLYTGDCIETGPYESPGEPYSGIPLEEKYLFNAWTY